MRFIHLSDLHLGIRIHELSMLDEQRRLLDGVLDAVRRYAPDALFICGDVYDKAIPPAEAVQLFDSFITAMSRTGVPTFVISGNHDSAERLSFGSSIMAENNVYFSPVYDGSITKVTLTDEYGETDVFMLPFIKPANVRRYFPDADISDYADAVRTALGNADITPGRRNILICHQFVNHPGADEETVGGIDNVDASVFDAFNYVALGHIHRRYSVMRDGIRYSGTNICFDFTQCDDERGIDLVTLDGEGNSTVELLPYEPIHKMRRICGRLADLTDPAAVDAQYADSYLQVTLTDEEETVDAIGRLRAFYPLLLRLDYDNTRTRTQNYINDGGDTDNRSPSELFAEFYEQQNGQPMNDAQLSEAERIIEEVWGDIR